jgi:ribosome-binding factor A
MNSRRLLKAAAAIREVVSMAILTEMRDPRVAGVTVIGVELAPDMRTAKVHVSIMGDEKKQQLCLHGLQNAAGFLQQKIAEGIDTRYTPRLQFVHDFGVKNSLEVARILHEVLPSEASAENNGAEDSEDIAADDAADDLAADDLAAEEDSPHDA